MGQRKQGRSTARRKIHCSGSACPRESKAAVGKPGMTGPGHWAQQTHKEEKNWTCMPSLPSDSWINTGLIEICKLMKKVLPHNSSYNETIKNSESIHSTDALYGNKKDKIFVSSKTLKRCDKHKDTGLHILLKTLHYDDSSFLLLFFLDSLSLIEGLVGVRNKRLKVAMLVGCKEDKKEKWGREGNMRQTL